MNVSQGGTNCAWDDVVNTTNDRRRVAIDPLRWRREEEDVGLSRIMVR